ncbi:DUF4920 domain-containing protein [Christiangramia sp. OXR-203]|uniref:DUF4920 domain-containing protein n=1 Tax=Christiangramia sp. OXR-203 TaxID=3100176 RepID=UPI002AC96ED2|nr:DUF4920 domain-containing protein [Christiangramia sp. OXR-203]WPY97954.1 DUF4920 domain-containing protein [Christiangramia sp. OXR-203]
MKKFAFILAFFCLLSCDRKKHNDEAEAVLEDNVEANYESYGQEISPKGTFSSSVMLEKYESLRGGDTINVKFDTKINSVCQSKGCWMVLELPGVDDVMVKFENYGFFVPKDAMGKDVIVRGKAFIEETSVEEQRHYAEDAGKSIDEVMAIREPVKKFGFTADGVLIKK